MKAEMRKARRRNKLFSRCVVALLVGALTLPALTVGAAEHEAVAPVHRDDTALEPSPDRGELGSSGGVSELFRRILEWVLRRGPELPEDPSEDPPVRPEYVPTIDPSGYAPDRD